MIGKRSFDEQALRDNYLAVVEEVLRAKPAAAKGKYVKSLTLSTTMGPGLRVDTGRLKDVDGGGGAVAPAEASA